LLVQGKLYGAGEFLQVKDYKSVVRWADAVARRPAVIRGRKVNGVFGGPAEQLRERHDASDFELRTQDKLSDS
jgi:GST-like protein